RATPSKRKPPKKHMILANADLASVSEGDLGGTSKRRTRRAGRTGQVRRETKLPKKQCAPQQLANEEGATMRRTWLESALWSSKQENKGHHNGKGEGNGNGQVTAQQDAALQLSPPAEKLSVDPSAENPMRSQVEYLPMEDIYFAAGIVNLRRGYS